MDVELIRFEQPGGDDHQVYLPRINWSGNQEYLENELEKNFSQFGPLYRAAAYRSRSFYGGKEGSENMWYAFVSFYSTWDVKEALQHDGKMKIGDSEVRIQKKSSNKPHEKRMLPVYKAQELLSYYLGFNSWTSKVVYVKIPREELCSEGVGIGEVPFTNSSPVSKGCAFTCVRRFAFHSAMQAAFSKFVIIRLRSGKITAEVDTTQCDNLIDNPICDRSTVQVQDISYDPEDEEECEDLEDITEEQLEELLNVSL